MLKHAIAHVSAAGRGEGVGDPRGGMPGLNRLGTPVPVIRVLLLDDQRAGAGGGEGLAQAKRDQD